MPKFKQLVIAFLLLCISGKAQSGFTFDIVPSSSFACTGQTSIYTATSSVQNLAYTWSVNPSKFASLSSTAGNFVIANFTKDLSYTITATATDGSVTVVNKYPVVAYRSAKASFNASLDASGYPANLQLTNYSSFASKTVWLYSDATQPDSVLSTIKSYTSSGSYSVTLIAFGQKECNDTSLYAFRISDSSSVVVPNVFTPNRDEINDIFRPISTGIVTLKASIFNRDGICLANWTTINGFWDGRTAAGEVCPEGVYIVVVEAKGFDGKNYKLKSTLTLLR